MGLKRTLNLLDATSVGVGAIIGAGIFVVLGLAIGYAGPAVIISIIIAGIVASFTAFSFAPNLKTVTLDNMYHPHASWSFPNTTLEDWANNLKSMTAKLEG